MGPIVNRLRRGATIEQFFYRPRSPSFNVFPVNVAHRHNDVGFEPHGKKPTHVPALRGAPLLHVGTHDDLQTNLRGVWVRTPVALEACHGGMENNASSARSTDNRKRHRSA